MLEAACDNVRILFAGGRSFRAAEFMWLAALVTTVPAEGQCEPVWSAVRASGGAEAFTVFDEDGDGPAPPMLFAGSSIRSIGVERIEGSIGTSVNNVARLDGWNWYSVGEGLGPLVGSYGFSLYGSVSPERPELTGVFAGGSGFHLVNPNLRGVARWNGSSWTSVGNGVELGNPRAFAFFNEGQVPLPSFFLGGTFQLTRGHPTISGLGRWDGIEWTDVGGGLREGVVGQDPKVWALSTFDEDGPGGKPPALFVGGSFRYAGNVHLRNIARWDGQEWSTVGGEGTSQPVNSMCIFDDGDGPQLYVGGNFSIVGGPPGQWISAQSLARWNGSQWSAVPGWGSVGGQVLAMTVWDDDGPGPNKPALFVTGSFWNNPNIPGSWNIAKWDGDRWYALPGGLTGLGGGYADSLQVFDDDGDGPNPGGLYVGGAFLWAGGIYTPGLARWGCPLTPPCLADCDFSTGFGTLDVFDFLCFLNRFHAEAPYACDCDVSTGDNVCDIFDFLCYGQRFQAGCP